jgi:hypothetical protein
MAIEADYQDKRDNVGRWNVIEPHLPREGVLVDLGSAQGYFALRAAATYPDLHVVSIEDDVIAAGVQREVAELAQMSNIRILRERFDGSNLHGWGIGVDCTLLLSVLHWFDDPAAILRRIGGMSSRIIVEHPDIGDVGACGASSRAQIGQIDEFARSLGIGDVEVIGRARRHTSTIDSWIVRIDSNR